MGRPLSAANVKPEGIHTLPRDNWAAGDFWLLIDGLDVTICAQRVGRPPTGEVTMPRELFNRLIRGYQRPHGKRLR